MASINIIKSVKETRTTDAYEVVEIDGINFRLGRWVFMVERNKGFEGALITRCLENLSEKEISAIKTAREFVAAKYGKEALAR